VNASKPAFNIPLEGVTVNGQAIAVNDTVEISFSTAIYAPEDFVRKIYASIPGAINNTFTYNGTNGTETESHYAMPCNSANLSVALHFGGQTYAIPAVDLTVGYEINSTEGLVRTGKCFGAIQSSPSGTWVIGRSFLANVYTVLRYDPPAVGFAQLHPSVQRNISSVPEPSTATPQPTNKPSAASRLDTALVAMILAAMLAVLF